MKIFQLRSHASSFVKRFSSDPRIDIPGPIGAVTGIIGLAADVGTPWGQFLGYLCTFVLVLAATSLLLCFLMKRQNQSSNFLRKLRSFSTATATYAVFSAFVLVPIFALNLALGSDRGVAATAMPEIAKLQDTLETRLVAIEAGVESVVESVDDQAEALRDQAKSLDAQADAIKEQTNSLDAQTTTLREMRETIDVSTAFEAIDRARREQSDADFGHVEAIGSLLEQEQSFSGANFRGIALFGLDLKEGDFNVSNFDLSDLSGVDASGSSMENAQFKFSSGDEDTNFAMANLTDAEFQFSSYSETSFDGADLRGANFMGAELRNASFVGANLQNATFEFSDLSGATFRDADLTNVRFLGAILDTVDFGLAVIKQTDFLGSRFSNTSLEPEQISGACRSWDATPLVVRTLVVLKGENGRELINKYSESLFLVSNEQNQWSLALCQSGMIYPDDYKNTYIESGLSPRRIEDLNRKFNVFYERYNKAKESGQLLGVECLKPSLSEVERRKKPWLCRP